MSQLRPLVVTGPVSPETPTSNNPEPALQETPRIVVTPPDPAATETPATGPTPPSVAPTG